MLFELTNKTAIITGASRGIGLAIARSLAHAGAKTYLVARTPETLHAACKHINDDIDIDTNTTTTTTTSAPTRHPAIPVPGDVSRPQTWDALLAHTDTVEPHLLVNAAGIAQTALLHKTSPDAIDALLHANLRSTILGCRAVGRHMMRRPLRERRNGQLSIINVASVMATHGQTGASVYAATKAGILGLTTSLSQELGHFGIRVNAILPGYIDTDMLQGQSHEKLAAKIPLGRLGRVDEVADAAVFLACNTYANNCHITLDGGLSGSF